MNTETIEQIKTLLAPIGEKIGQSAEFGWAVIMKQQMVEGYINIITLIIGVLLVILTVYLAKKSDWSGVLPRWNEAIAFICGIIASIAILIGLIDFLSEGIGQLINPEYYAIKFLIGLVQ